MATATKRTRCYSAADQPLAEDNFKRGKERKKEGTATNEGRGLQMDAFGG